METKKPSELAGNVFELANKTETPSITLLVINVKHAWFNKVGGLTST